MKPAPPGARQRREYISGSPARRQRKCASGEVLYSRHPINPNSAGSCPPPINFLTFSRRCLRPSGPLGSDGA